MSEIISGLAIIGAINVLAGCAALVVYLLVTLNERHAQDPVAAPRDPEVSSPDARDSE